MVRTDTFVPQTAHSFATHFDLLGDGFWERCEELGGLHSMTLLGEVLYLTTDANVIKVGSS